MLFDELDLSWLLRPLLPLTTTATAMAATTARMVAATAATTRPRSYDPTTQLRPDHESEAARRAQRTKGSRRGGRRLLVVVILRQLATKKASMPTVHGFGGSALPQRTLTLSIEFPLGLYAVTKLVLRL